MIPGIGFGYGFPSFYYPAYPSIGWGMMGYPTFFGGPNTMAGSLVGSGLGGLLGMGIGSLAGGQNGAMGGALLGSLFGGGLGSAWGMGRDMQMFGYGFF
ncbi:MAG: hypothetical protein AB1758_00165 [Candidatus Eremiobacterota bacterium]